MTISEFFANNQQVQQQLLVQFTAVVQHEYQARSLIEWIHTCPYSGGIRCVEVPAGASSVTYPLGMYLVDMVNYEDGYCGGPSTVIVAAINEKQAIELVRAMPNFFDAHVKIKATLLGTSNEKLPVVVTSFCSPG